MPKVETSNPWGKQTTVTNKNVSNTIGNKIGSRNRRDVEEHPPARRRVVKKLVRVEPVHNSTHEENRSEENRIDENVQRPRRRKKLIIKKKKRPLGRVEPTTVLPRRRVVVTRKRLLNTLQTQSTTTEDDFFVSTTPSEEIDYPTTEPEYDSANDDVEDSTEPDYEEASVTEEEPITEPESLEYESNSTSIDEVPQNLPDYEPFFPELSESLDSPVLLLKTTVLSSVEIETKTLVQSRLRTYTFLITRVNGDEKIVTSTTEVKPHTKTIVTTEPHTKYTTLTLLDLDNTQTLSYIPQTAFPSSMEPSDVGESYLL